MMRLHFFQHVPFEGLGSIEAWGRDRGYRRTATKFYQKDPLPDLDDIDWLIVMGGPMGAYEEERHPWLAEEKRFIARAIAREKVVLGICLGAQLIAEVLGAKVYPNEVKEIGWFPIELTEAGRRSALFDFLSPKFDVFHWHGDTFDLPKGAVRIARSEGCLNQAFVYGERVVALQFHLEITPEGAEALIRHGSGDLAEGKYIQTPDQMLERREAFGPIHEKMREILTRLERRFLSGPDSSV